MWVAKTMSEWMDVLAKLALNEHYTNINIPYADLMCHAKLHIWDTWQLFWDQQVHSKFNAVHPELGLWPRSSQEHRRDELIICRLRIRHMYLLSGYPPPVCVSCQVRLSVEPILIHCVEYIYIIYLYFNVHPVRELFDTILYGC